MSHSNLVTSFALILISSAQAASPEATCWSASQPFNEKELGLSEKICIETAGVTIGDNSATLQIDRGKASSRTLRAQVIEYTAGRLLMSTVLESKDIENGDELTTGSIEMFFDTTLTGSDVKVTRVIGETKYFSDRWHRLRSREQSVPFNAVAPETRGANDLECTGAQAGTFSYAKRLTGSWLVFKTELRLDEYLAKPFAAQLSRYGTLDVTNRFEDLGSDDDSIELRFDGTRFELIRNRDSRPPRWMISENVSCR